MKKIYICEFEKDLVDNSYQSGVKNINNKWLSALWFALKNDYEVTFSLEEADVVAQFCHSEYTRARRCYNPKCLGCDKPHAREPFLMEAIQSIYGDSKEYLFYIWDFYTWSLGWNSAGVKHEGGSFDWARLYPVLKKCKHVLCPNFGTQQNLYRFDIDAKIVLPFTRFWDEHKIEDNNYVAVACRPYAIDPTDEWLIEALKSVGIPYVATYENEKDFDDPYNFQKLITNCSFIASAKFEASTGGMSLVEAYNCGKPVLISNSMMNGANDIFGDRAFKFQYGDFKNLQACLLHLWNNRPKLELEDCRNFCKNFTADAMAERIIEVIEE